MEGIENVLPKDDVPDDRLKEKKHAVAHAQQVTEGEAECLRKECEKRPYLDGRYFAVDVEYSDINSIVIGICQICTPKRKIKGSLRCPSNFTTHLQRVHSELYTEYKKYKVYKRMKLNDVCEVREQKCESSSCTSAFTQSGFENNVTNYVLESTVPLSTVEMPAFRKIFDDLNVMKDASPLQHLGSHTLKRKIKGMYKEYLDDVRWLISEKITYVCTTADIWTSRSRTFMGVTAHWIDPDSMERKAAAIACRRFPETYSYDRIARVLNEIHVSFGLNLEKLVATVTDNGSNNVKAFQEFGIDISNEHCRETFVEMDDNCSEVSESSDNDSNQLNTDHFEDHAIYQSFGEAEMFSYMLFRHVRCASHTLNLIATTDALKAIRSVSLLSKVHDEAITRCTTLWKMLRSPKQAELLISILGHSLLQPEFLRWNSLFDALRNILSMKEKISEVNLVLGNKNHLRDIDFKYIGEYLTCMKPIAETIDVLQEENCWYYGYLLPSLVSLRRKLMQVLDQNEFQYCQPIIEGVLDSVNIRFDDLLHINGEGHHAAIAAVMHPRFKAKWTGCLAPVLQKKVRSAVMQAVLEQAEITMEEKPKVENTCVDAFFDFDNASNILSGDSLISGHCESELEVLRYMQDTRVEIETIQSYPLIRKAFLKFNTPLPTSAPVEQLFSYETVMDFSRYNHLTEKEFEQRVLLRIQRRNKCV